MRILMYGAGAIGSIFAGKLAQAGIDVTILARNRRYEELIKFIKESKQDTPVFNWLT